MSDSEKLRELAELLQRVDAALGRSEVNAALVNTIGYETACNLREDVRNQVENKLTVFLCGPFQEETMKVQKLKAGDSIEVGDRILSDGTFGKSWYEVRRVTKRYAFVAVNEHAEIKFPSIYSEFGFNRLPREKWPTISYSAWRPKLA